MAPMCRWRSRPASSPDYSAAICNGHVMFKLARAIIPAPRRLTGLSNNRQPALTGKVFCNSIEPSRPRGDDDGQFNRQQTFRRAKTERSSGDARARSFSHRSWWLLELRRRTRWPDFPTPVIGTTSGPVRGVSDGVVNNFRGIRYANSTAGANRWMPPTAPSRSPTIFDATSRAVRARSRFSSFQRSSP